nr:unnamed protein product [Haemonchus contortus]
MLRFLLNAFCFFELIHIIYGEESSCYSTNDVKYSCKRRIILAIDDTSDIARKRGQEFSIANSVMRCLDIRGDMISIALTTYGTKSPVTYGFDNDRYQTCYDFGYLWKGSDSAIEAKPWRKIQNLFNRIISTIDISDALLVLFTKDSEQKDVDAASDLLQDYITKGVANNFSALVINMGDSSFNSWPENTDIWMNSMDDTKQIADYVSRFVCGPPTTTTTTLSIVRTTTSTPPSSTTTSSLPTTTSGTTTASPPEPIPVKNINSGCECVPKTIWLDVFLLMEAGVSMTSYGIASATDFVVSAFTKLTVGQAEQFQTRLGVIRYASSVDLVADLDAYKSTADLLDLDILPLNETDTNLEGYVKYFHKSRI